MVSMHADNKEGLLETTSFLPEGNRLIVNADVSKGRLAVEVLDSKGVPFNGYSKKECLIFRGNEISLQVRWNNNACIPSGIPIRLRFYFSKGGCQR